MTAPSSSRPVQLTSNPAAGILIGSNGRYEKHLRDLDGLYRDAGAFAAALGSDSGAPVYWVEQSLTQQGRGGLITGLSVVEPGRVGDEYAMTRGHIHAQSQFAELYTCLNGQGVLLMDTLDGETVAMAMRPGDSVYVPGGWVHRSVNVGAERFVTLFCYGSEAGKDYEVIRRADGMRELVVIDGAGGWKTVPNLHHVGYSLAS